MQSYLPLITGSGGALVVLAVVAYLLGIGKLHSDAEHQRLADEIRDLKTALETERVTNNELARAGGVTTKVLDALVEVATGRHDHDQAVLPHLKDSPSTDLTPEDLGLLCDCDCGGAACWTWRAPGSSPRLRCRGAGSSGPVSRSSNRWRRSPSITSSRR